MNAREIAAEWDECARNWRILDRADRADVCEQLAAYWRLPLWRRVWRSHRALDLCERLHRMDFSEMLEPHA